MEQATLRQSSQPKRTYVPPVPTRAAIGHAIGAQQKYLRQPAGGEEWKMTKFRTTESKVTQYMGGRTGTSAAAAMGTPGIADVPRLYDDAPSDQAPADEA